MVRAPTQPRMAVASTESLNVRNLPLDDMPAAHACPSERSSSSLASSRSCTVESLTEDEKSALAEEYNSLRPHL